MGRKPHPDLEKAKAGIEVDIVYMDFKSINETASIWELEDGSRINVHTILEEVFVSLDSDTNEEFRDKNGVPKIGMVVAMRTRFEPSEELLKKGKGVQ